MIAVLVVCGTVLALAMLVREDRRMSRVESAEVQKLRDLVAVERKRIDDLAERANGWTATSRRVAVLDERRKS